jgi:two-component system, cell cycle response regulator DivK
MRFAAAQLSTPSIASNAYECEIIDYEFRRSHSNIEISACSVRRDCARLHEIISMLTGPRRILIVEDDEASRRGLRQLLSHAGYTVLSASTFDEGKYAAAEGAPDLLIADVRLGAFNGLQLVAAARQAVPTIIVTGFPDPVLEAEALRLGARYMTKPIEPSTLLALIEEMLNTAARRRVVGSTRRWDRKQVVGQVFARVEGDLARLVDVSVGGLQFEIDREQPLPASFTVSVAPHDLSLDAHLVWETQRGDQRWVCGAALSWGNTSALRHWAALVNDLPSSGAGAS